MKKLYIPFSVKDAGTLSTRLQFSEDIQVGLKPEKKERGEYKGFKNAQQQSDLVYAPQLVKGEYQPTTKLADLVGEGDRLYINAHCNRGLDYFATDVKCEGGKVDYALLVKQLQAHGLPPTTRATIKLWACHAALGYMGKPAFASAFSKAMSDADYKQCKIFAYTESLHAHYLLGKDDTEQPRQFHKYANVNESESERLDKVIVEILKTRQPESLFKLWNTFLGMKSGDAEQAKLAILDAPLLKKFIGESNETASVGARASRFRKQFKDGQMVG